MRESHALYELQLFWDCKKHAISFYLIVGYFKASFGSNLFQIQRRLTIVAMYISYRHLGYLSKGIVNNPAFKWKRNNKIHLESLSISFQFQNKINFNFYASLLFIPSPKSYNKSKPSHRTGGIINFIYPNVVRSFSRIIIYHQSVVAYSWLSSVVFQVLSFSEILMYHIHLAGIAAPPPKFSPNSHKWTSSQASTTLAMWRNTTPEIRKRFRSCFKWKMHAWILWKRLNSHLEQNGHHSLSQLSTPDLCFWIIPLPIEDKQ